MFKNTRQQGASFEALARAFLERQGMTFVANNVSFKCGELDLIMKEGNTFVFVEVRQRKQKSFGSAVESVDWRKQQRWLDSANLWLAQQNLSLEDANCRFDLIAFEGSKTPQWIANFLDD